ncbi:MAG TPA: M24 family metallopeptidase, partial [Candidatus Saccharimonadia bacterium]
EDMLASELAAKVPDELRRIKHAQAITDQTFTDILGIIKAGMTEKAVAAEIVYLLLKHGADQIPEHFWPIVASGPNSAIVHAHPTDRKLSDGDVVLLDFGCLVEGYTSDMSRTLVLGKASDKIKKVYAIVLEAQQAALAAAKAGISGMKLDAVARSIIESAGYEIPHGVGHSLGLEIHEEPRINPRNPNPLPENAVMTIEPGIYIPGEFGVRIEDMVRLTKIGSENLTASPKELIELHPAR